MGRSPGGGHGNPLQHSCLENPMDRGPQRATVHEVAKSQTQLTDWACTQWPVLADKGRPCRQRGCRRLSSSSLASAWFSLRRLTGRIALPSPGFTRIHEIAREDAGVTVWNKLTLPSTDEHCSPKFKKEWRFWKAQGIWVTSTYRNWKVMPFLLRNKSQMNRNIARCIPGRRGCLSSDVSTIRNESLIGSIPVRIFQHSISITIPLQDRYEIPY